MSDSGRPVGVVDLMTQNERRRTVYHIFLGSSLIVMAVSFFFLPTTHSATEDFPTEWRKLLWDGFGSGNVNSTARTKSSSRLPRPTDRTAWGNFGVNFVGIQRMSVGLGRSARGYLASFEALGLPFRQVHVEGFGNNVNVDRSLQWDDASKNFEVSIFHLNPGPMLESFLQKEDLVANFWKDHFRVVIPYYETDFPSSAAAHFLLFHEIWAPTPFVAQLVLKCCPHCTGKVRLVRPYVPPWDGSSQFGNASVRRPYTFYFGADMMSSCYRKNPLAFARACLRLSKKRKDVRCVMKILHLREVSHLVELGALKSFLRSADARNPVFIVITSFLEEDEMAELFSAADAYVSTSKAEGLGLGILEALSVAKPVIATGYGGLSDFLTPDIALVVPFSMETYTLGEIFATGSPFANPSEENLYVAMEFLARNPEEGRKMGAMGKKKYESVFIVQQKEGMSQALHALKDQVRMSWTLPEAL